MVKILGFGIWGSTPREPGLLRRQLRRGWGSVFRVWGLGCGVWGVGFRVSNFGCQISDFRLRVSSYGVSGVQIHEIDKFRAESNLDKI